MSGRDLRPLRRRFRTRQLIAPVLAACLILGACSSDDDAANGTDGAAAADAEGGIRLRLAIGDNNIREEGAECAGARPFHYVHADAAYSIEDEDGEVFAEGRLPAGEAFNADPSVDWGVDRIPTICVMEFDIGELPDGDSYYLQLPRGSGLAFDPDDRTPEGLVLVTLG